MSLFQGFDQRGGVDEFSPARIDETGAAFHLRERSPVQKMMSLRGQRNVQRKNVAGGQQRVELRVFHPIPAGPLRGGQRIVSEHSSAKAAKNLGGDPADPARSDDADGLAENIETHQTVE